MLLDRICSNWQLTYHQEWDCEVFPARGLERPQHRPHDGTADADKGDHHDEPPDGDSLGHEDAAAGLGAAVKTAVLLVGKKRGMPRPRSGSGEEKEEEKTHKIYI